MTEIIHRNESHVCHSPSTKMDSVYLKTKLVKNSRLQNKGYYVGINLGGKSLPSWWQQQQQHIAVAGH